MKDKGLFIKESTGVVRHTVISEQTGNFSYAFIKPDDRTLDDLFCHYRDIEPWKRSFKELRKGDRVKFEAYETDRGMSARNVSIIKEAKRDFEEGGTDARTESTI